MIGRSAQAAFSRIVAVDHLGQEPSPVDFVASAEERRQLAGQLGLDALDSLSAQLVLTRAGDEVRLTGRWAADVVQTCVVSLEPVRSRLEETIERVYAPPGAAPDEDEIEVELAAADPPDALVDDRVDVGEAVAEQLALAIDPYPRKPGASLDPRYTADTPEKESPFAVLKSLRR